MDGVIKGKAAYQYDINRDKSKKGRFNSLVSRTVRKGSTCADLCCGTGISIEFLLAKADKVYGVEASHDMIKICLERFRNEKRVELVESDAYNTPLKSNSIDFVLIRMGLHHIEDKIAVLNEAHRILKNDGKLIVIDKFAIKPRFITEIVDYVKRAFKDELSIKHHFITIEEFTLQSITNIFKIESQNIQKHGSIIKANFVFQKVSQ